MPNRNRLSWGIFTTEGAGNSDNARGYEKRFVMFDWQVEHCDEMGNELEVMVICMGFILRSLVLIIPQLHNPPPTVLVSVPISQPTHEPGVKLSGASCRPAITNRTSFTHTTLSHQLGSKLGSKKMSTLTNALTLWRCV